MTKHTPGPWIFKDGSIYQDRKDGLLVAFAVGPPGQAAAAGAGDWATYEALYAVEAADALLIAAAPDLLAALRGILSPDGKSVYATRELITAAGAAIAKATGGLSTCCKTAGDS